MISLYHISSHVLLLYPQPCWIILIPRILSFLRDYESFTLCLRINNKCLDLYVKQKKIVTISKVDVFIHIYNLFKYKYIIYLKQNLRYLQYNCKHMFFEEKYYIFQILFPNIFCLRIFSQVPFKVHVYTFPSCRKLSYLSDTPYVKNDGTKKYWEIMYVEHISMNCLGLYFKQKIFLNSINICKRYILTQLKTCKEKLN